MNKKLTVTVAIPAFNEEKNIQVAINSVILQNQKKFTLDKIIVLSDGSTDDTVSEVNKIKNSKIILVHDSKRMGKLKRLNQGYSLNKSDVLVQLDADIELKDRNTLEKLVSHFITNPKTDVVYGNQIPFKPKSYIGRLGYFGFYSWEEAKNMVNADRYNCYGCMIAFSKSFLKKYRLPENKNYYYAEDTYSFYYAKQNNSVTYFEKSAAIYFKLPETFSDYVKQMNRYLTTADGLRKSFSDEIINKYETITYKVKLMSIIRNSFKSGIQLAIGYFTLQFVANIYTVFHKQSPLWQISKSSK